MGEFGDDCDCTKNKCCTCHINPLNCDKTNWKCNNCGHNLKKDCEDKKKGDAKALELSKVKEQERGKAAGSVYVKVEK